MVKELDAFEIARDVLTNNTWYPKSYFQTGRKPPFPVKIEILENNVLGMGSGPLIPKTVSGLKIAIGDYETFGGDKIGGADLFFTTNIGMQVRNYVPPVSQYINTTPDSAWDKTTTQYKNAYTSKPFDKVYDWTDVNYVLTDGDSLKQRPGQSGPDGQSEWTMEYSTADGYKGVFFLRLFKTPKAQSVRVEYDFVGQHMAKTTVRPTADTQKETKPTEPSWEVYATDTDESGAVIIALVALVFVAISIT